MVARSTSLDPYLLQRSLSLSFLPKDPPDWDNEAEPALFKSLPPQNLDRMLCSSDIYRFDDARLPRVLLSVLYKMLHSPVIPPSVSVLRKGWPVIHVTKNNWDWKKVTEDDIPLTFCSRVPSYFQSAYLLADLGGGGDGRAWLASTPSGMVCVLKFSMDEDCLEQEKIIWNKVCPSADVKVKQLNGMHVLVMPWLKPCAEEEWKKPEIREAVRVAVMKLSSLGYKHDDLHNRHVGLYRKDSRVNALLFDYARVLEVDPATALSEMLQDLEL